jgi:hypothetical protein
VALLIDIKDIGGGHTVRGVTSGSGRTRLNLSGVRREGWLTSNYQKNVIK